MQIREALIMGREFLNLHNIQSANLDAQVLLSKVTGLDRTGLFLQGERDLTAEQQQQYRSLLDRRAWGEPVAYLTGFKEFMGLDFVVTPAVLIPRPDTELLVETALEYLKKTHKKNPLAVDVGTGSGAIAISLACLVPELRVLAIDLSAEALAIARQNARLHRVEGRIDFMQGNLLEPMPPEMKGSIDVITANLPYIPSGDIPGLMPDVKDFEPHLALDGGLDGLDLYRLLIPGACRFLQPGGLLLMEIGPGQGEPARRILPADRWHSEIKLDLAGRQRLVAAKKK
ncbi:peptide chain release factor N(5)-glutamine methyltransferase [Desulforamulus putei]|uniref:Release factor glutamine methyltransferase n=1 Tax=Desulforamulus putei DSM 12395 TaxID=1121429 RepID=A0A1M4XV50_9FIRM|nr:peptide chain release factor N(5)-glutamine methyltransferase [Desulforamulus putei]SHE97298.1 release factor glutamine methyltransferase [Desulforamulus putei DSM 12395]